MTGTLPAVASGRYRAMTLLVSGPVLVLTAASLWGTVGPARALVHDDLPALVVGGWRQLLGGAVLLVPVMARRARPSLLRIGCRPAVIVAAAATGVYQILFLYAVTAVGAGLATAVALGVAPAATGLCSWLWQRVRPRMLWAVSTVICAAGTTLLLSGAPSGPPPSVLGLLAALGAGLCYGLYTVAASTTAATEGIDMTAVAAVTLLLGALPCLPAMAIHAPAVFHPAPLLLLLWLGVFTCGAAYWYFMRGMKSITASTAGTLSLAEPVAAVCLSVVLLGEKLSATQITGCALVIVGLAVTAIKARRQTNRPDVPVADNASDEPAVASRTTARPGPAAVAEPAP